MNLRIYIILLLILTVAVLKAQTVSEPCARILNGIGQDSVVWNAVPCANFDGFIIYAGPEGTTPIPIDTITDPNARGYRNPNTGEIALIYRVAMICGGLIVSSTGIVSNQKPVTPDIRSVSIINANPVLSWNPSPSPEVIGYQIYKENPYGSGNFFPYPANNQIVNALSFTDTNSSSLLVRYAIVAVSRCNAGLLGEGNVLDGTTGPHSSMFLETTIDDCSGDITLSWNEYENWRDGVDFYIVRMTRNGGSPQNIDSVNTTAYIFPAAQNGDVLEFWIEAREKNQNNNALSNRVNMDIIVNRKMDYLYLTATTIDASSQKPLINWRWDTDTDFGTAFLQRSTDSINWENAVTIPGILNESNSISDLNADSDNQSYYYRIFFTDACGGTLYSNKAATIHLTGKAADAFQNNLNWTPFYVEFAEVDKYDVRKIVAANNYIVETLSASDSNYTDRLNVNFPDEARSCYYLEARGVINILGNPPRFTFSRSNTVCPEQKAVLWFPNAFVPAGKNNVFKPLAGFGSTLESYTLRIFDRYGTVIFESNEVDRGWDGMGANKPMPQGVYVYVCRYLQSDGTSEIIKGTLMLIR